MKNQPISYQEIFAAVRHLLIMMDKRRENLFRKFRPIMAVFAFYIFVWLLFPYIDFGVPRNLRGGLFYFMVLAGGIGLFVVLTIYYRQMLELKEELEERWSRGLASVIPEFEYHEKGEDLEGVLNDTGLFAPFDQYESRHMHIGRVNDVIFHRVEVAMSEKEEGVLPKSKSVFKGVIFGIRFNSSDESDKPLSIRFHKPNLLRNEVSYTVLRDGKNINQRIKLIEYLWKVNKEAFKRRQIAEGLRVCIHKGVLLVALEQRWRFTELFNWEPCNRIEYVESELWIWNSLLAARNYL